MPESDAERSPADATLLVAQDPSRDQLDALFALYHQGELSVVLEQAEALVKSFPASFTLWQLVGAANLGMQRLDQAVQAFTQACESRPDNAAAYNNLATVLQAQGKIDQAINAYLRVISIKSDLAVAHYNLATILQSIGEYDQAIAAYGRAIEINPDDPAAHNNLGALLTGRDQTDRAIIVLQDATEIHRDHPELHFNLGNALKKNGRLDEAIVAWQRAVAIKPDYADAYASLGLAFLDQGKLDEAIAACQHTIAIKPDHADALHNLGIVFYAQHRLDDAIAAYQRAIAITPDHADAHYNLGISLYDNRKLDEAIAAYQRAIAIRPEHADAHYNLGISLYDERRLEEAIVACQRAIAINPDRADAHSSLGVTLYAQGKLDEAIAAHQRAIAIKPDHAVAHWNTSLAFLTKGDFQQGWEYHEWRWKCQELPRSRIAGKPLWLGGPSLKDRTILLWGEQGLGDQIQFARYASRISGLGARVILEVNDALVRVLGKLDGVSKVVGAGTPVPDSEFDFHCPLMSLPLALETELSTIPDVPRITAHIKDVPRWAERAPSSVPKIGIAWSGNPNHKNDRNRSVALSQLEKIITPSITWISLQKEVRDADRSTLDAIGRIHHFGDQLVDLLDTAALCEHCDLVISVDTSIAHLAGTLRRPVWLLLPFAVDWRWLQDRDDSPWYPTMKLYRQQQIGDWEGVVQRVSADLQAWMKQR
jgi:tetratricopeptide (TPR) repeat protein